ncbi:MAG: ribosomal protein S18-alanine N-acetyltransferase [Alphaproteobacteria bacterium]|nr:ribosomal protein S18-alanine N-acetyltransferase [Alphaproteobacteria bacterium]MCL2889803.1 ribosomal protein S18-alanine N-acetyltransferase [Alphaproteobacteria bacterium]
MLKQIANLHKLCFPNKPWNADEFASLQKSGCEILASDNGFIVFRCAADECEIITIGVAPYARGTGVASTLLHLMENDLKNKNIKKIFLEAADDNQPARALYKKHGYKQIGVRPKYYDDIDAIVMEKILSNEFQNA